MSKVFLLVVPIVVIAAFVYICITLCAVSYVARFEENGPGWGAENNIIYKENADDLRNIQHP